MTKTPFPKGLGNRMRDKNGTIHQKRSDTLVKTLRMEVEIADHVWSLEEIVKLNQK